MKKQIELNFTLGEQVTLVDRAGEVGVGTVVSRTFEETVRYDLKMNLDGAIIKGVTADDLRRTQGDTQTPKWRKPT
jgi:phage-related protein